MPRKKLTPAQQAASDKIGKILAKKKRETNEQAKAEVSIQSKAEKQNPINPKSGEARDKPEVVKKDAKEADLANGEPTWQEEIAKTGDKDMAFVGLSHEQFEQFKKDTTPQTTLQSWHLGLCERLSKGESLGAILSDYEIAPAKFFKELDENPELKKAHDDAMRCAARLAEYNLMYLAVSGTSADKKALAPGLIEKYGGEAPKVSGEEDKQEGETSGLE